MRFWLERDDGYRVHEPFPDHDFKVAFWCLDSLVEHALESVEQEWRLERVAPELASILARFTVKVET